ncbi:DMT family transporter [Coralliovum pocilloporae]|uniref:DMT family transporter n=1 Tax=Coralliovum pocilloporae TaxID=3066369 RepID=UPI0033072CF3
MSSLRLGDFAVLIVILFSWACNFVAIRFSVTDLSVTTTLLGRFCLVGILLSPFLKWPDWQTFRQLCLLTLVLVAGHFGFLFWALQETSSVAGIAVFVQLGPAFSVLMAWLLLGEIPGIRRIIGLGVGFSGIIILYYDPGLLSSQFALLLAVLCAFFLGCYNVLVKWCQGVNAVNIIGWTSILGIPIMALGTMLEGASPVTEVQNASLTALIALCYTALIGSILGHGLWAWMLQKHPVSVLAPLTLAVPIITTLASAFATGEAITLRFVLASAVVLAGGWFILRSPPVLERMKDGEDRV